MEFNFAANGVVETIDAVPEAFRAAYEEKDGKFSVRPDFAGIATAVDGLNRALKSERTTTSTLKGQKDVGAVLKEFAGVDTPEALKTKLEEMTAQLAAKGNIDPQKIRAEIESTFAAERTTLQGNVTAMETTLTEYLVDNNALAALSAAKGNAELLMPHIRSNVKVVKDEASGKYVTRVLDADKQFRGDGKGGFMGVADLVAEMRQSKSFGVAFESEAPAGGQQNFRGQPASRSAAAQSQRREAGANASPTDKISAGLAKNQAGR